MSLPPVFNSCTFKTPKLLHSTAKVVSITGEMSFSLYKEKEQINDKNYCQNITTL